MDWTRLTPTEFVEKLSLEGLGAAPEVIAQYDSLPWNLKIIWWTNFRSGPATDLRNLVVPSEVRDPDFLFWIRLTTKYRNSGDKHDYTKDLNLRARSFAWFDDLFKKPSVASPSCILRRILLGEVTDSAAFELFGEFDRTNLLRHLLDIKPDTSHFVWDKLWAETSSDSGRILSHPLVPIACIDRWRTENIHNAEEGNIFALAVTYIPTLPEHWIQEILSDTSNPKNLKPLAAYLHRRDIPISVRKSFRKHPDKHVKRAAWQYGEYTDEELSSIDPEDWGVLVSRLDPIRPDMALKMLANLTPQVFKSGVPTPGFTPESELLLLTNHSQSPVWREHTTPEILDAALVSNQEIWLDMAAHAYRSWGPSRLEKLLNLILPLPETTLWTVKRLLHLGSITPDKPMLKKMLQASSRDVRILATQHLSKTSPSLRL